MRKFVSATISHRMKSRCLLVDNSQQMDGSGMELSSEDSGGSRKVPASTLSSVQTADMLNDIAEQCANFGLGDSLLEKEALAAIREIGFAVRMISLPESLPRTADLVFMNLITLEG